MAFTFTQLFLRGNAMRNAGIIATIAVASFLAIPAARAQQTLDISGIRVWLERADAIRGSEGYSEDNDYTSYQIAAGSFRNFTTNACWLNADNPNCTQALDGSAAWDATAAPRTSARVDGSPLPAGSYHPDVLHSTPQTQQWASCGQWLNSVLVYGGKLYGFSHGESPKQGDTTCGIYRTHHKTMTLWTSPVGPNAGLAGQWTNPTLIIDATDGDGGNSESGEGDCNAITDNTYAYLFCRHPAKTMEDPGRAYSTALARAPLTRLTSFIKYNNGWGQEPGVNGADSDLAGKVWGTTSTTSNQLGTGASVWKDRGWMMLLGITDGGFGGLKASFTTLSNLRTNEIGFTTLPDPLFVQETNSNGGYPYGGNPPHYLYIYPSVVSLVDGTRTWDLTKKNQFLLAYAFVPPHNNLSHRILAMRSVTVSKSSTAQDPQVLVALTTRYDSTYKQYYSSTQPVAYGIDTSFSYVPGTFSQTTVDTVGYVPQIPQNQPTSQGQTLTKIVECRSSVPWPSGHPDHLITTVSCDSNYNEETVAGYSYPRKPATGSSVQIYRCSSSTNQTHWVSTSKHATVGEPRRSHLAGS
jgi:hypothetical protein